MVGTFFSRIYKMPSRRVKGLKINAFLCELVMRITNGSLPADSLNKAFPALGLSPVILDELASNMLLGDIALELFTKSDPTLNPKGKPLGPLAEQLVMYLTGLLEERPEVMGLLENPLLHSYGSIEQTYLDCLQLSKGVKDSV
jgi:hypothetical protein